MKITEIVVSEGTTFNHPYQSYSNYRPSITLKTTLHEYDEGHEYEAIKILQQQARAILEQDKQSILSRLEREEQERNSAGKKKMNFEKRTEKRLFFENSSTPCRCSMRL